MFITDSQLLILRELQHGALNPTEIAAATDLAPFTVRADLRALKRDRLVQCNWLGHARCEWELTNAGHMRVFHEQQLELKGWG